MAGNSLFLSRHNQTSSSIGIKSSGDSTGPSATSPLGFRLIATAFPVKGPGLWKPLSPGWTLHSIEYEDLLLLQISSVWFFATPWTAAWPGFPVLHHLPEFAQTHVHRVGDAIQPSHPLLSPSPLAFSLPQHQGLLMNCLFAPGGQIIGASTLASVLPMNIQGWFPLGLTGLISL